MKFEFSAGGVVYRKGETGIEILVGQHSGHHLWIFPKGLIGDEKKGETKEETAIREVKEETGITGKILHPLTPVVYWFQWEGVKHKKTVYYFVMEYISGKTEEHGWEMEKVEWLPIAEVDTRLDRSSDKKAWQEAKAYIEKRIT